MDEECMLMLTPDGAGEYCFVPGNLAVIHASKRIVSVSYQSVHIQFKDGEEQHTMGNLLVLIQFSTKRMQSSGW